MADFNSSLPVKTLSNGDVVVEIADGSTPSQKLAVNASGSAQVTGAGSAGTPDAGVVSVQGVSGGQALPVSGTVTANQGTAAALSGAWPVEITDGTDVLGVAAHPLRIDPTGTTTQPVSGTVTANQGGAPWSMNLTEVGGAAVALGQAAMAASIPVVIASDQSDVKIDIDKIAGAAGSASNSLPVQISTGSAYVSSTNPLPVTIDPISAGTAVVDYKDAAATAAGGTDNHDYTVTAGKTLHLQQIESSASGAARMELQIETGVASGTFTTKAVQFNSTATPDMSLRLSSEIQVAAGVRVRVVMKNREVLSAEDLYSTIIGFEI